MRRTIGLLVPALLALALLLAPTVALADEAVGASGPPAGELVLAAEAEPTGPEPQDRLREDNPARELAGYEDREIQFTWAAAWLLLFLGVTGLVALVGLYYLLVHRPSQQAEGRS
jgi:hypothetical protein